MPERVSRRAVLLAGAAAAAAPASALAAADEGGALTALVQAEEDAAYAYREAGLRDLGLQESEHARAIATHLEALTLPVPRPREDTAGLGAPALALVDARGVAQRRRAAIALERELIAGCERRLAQLVDPNTIRTVAAVLASHAQHVVVHELSGRR